MRWMDIKPSSKDIEHFEIGSKGKILVFQKMKNANGNGSANKQTSGSTGFVDCFDFKESSMFSFEITPLVWIVVTHFGAPSKSKIKIICNFAMIQLVNAIQTWNGILLQF